MKLSKKLIVKPWQKVKLSEIDPDDTHGWKDKDSAREQVEKNVKCLTEMQYLLYAENKHSVLVIFQAMDAGGKDGVIRRVMSGLNPQSCRVTSFKKPSADEVDHDFLWRIHHAVPPRGEIGIFNRSHYEDVLIVRVHNIVPKEVWSKRYEDINDFEKYLTRNNTTVVKFFLHISKDEQRERLLARLHDPNKNWKITPDDASERKHWDDYIAAYEEALSRCSTKRAPWYIIPANKKWFRDLAVSHILCETLQNLDMKMPKATVDLSKIKID